MWKAKVKDQLLARAIAFMWTWNEHTGKGYLWPKMASDMISECQKIFMAGVCPSSPSRYVLRRHWMCPCCAHINCSSWLRHWSKYNTSYTLTFERHIIHLVSQSVDPYRCDQWNSNLYLLIPVILHLAYCRCTHFCLPELSTLYTKTQMQITALYT